MFAFRLSSRNLFSLRKLTADPVLQDDMYRLGQKEMTDFRFHSEYSLVVLSRIVASVLSPELEDRRFKLRANEFFV